MNATGCALVGYESNYGDGMPIAIPTQYSVRTTAQLCVCVCIVRVKEEDTVRWNRVARLPRST